MFEVLKIGIWNLFGICLPAGDVPKGQILSPYGRYPEGTEFGACCKAALALVCSAGFSHSEIPGSKVATHLPEAYRSYATSFIAIQCQGIHHLPL